MTLKRQAGPSLTELVDRACADDREAWDQIVDRMNNMVWSVVRGFRLSEADSVDAAQMTWLRTIENLNKVREPERLGLWIATTARRECLRLIERRSRTTPVDPQAHNPVWNMPDAVDIEDLTLDRGQVELVVEALEKLGEDCQAILRMVLSQPPLSYKEISAALGIAVGSIGPRRKRCMNRLRLHCGF